MSEINIHETSWHYRLYNWWRTTSGFTKPDGWRENRCHYLRVVIFWAPLGWFLRHDLFGIELLRPWIVLMLSILLGVVVYLFVVAPIKMLAFTGMVLAALVGIFGVMWLLEHRIRNPFLRAVILLVTLPVWGPIMAIGKVLYVIFQQILEPIWFTQHRFSLPLWILTIVGVYALIGILGGAQLLFTALMMTATLAVIIGVLVLVVIGIMEGIPALMEKYRDWRWSRRYRKSGDYITSSGQPRRRRTGTVDLFWRMSAFKNGSKICPYVNLPHQWQEQ